MALLIEAMAQELGPEQARETKKTLAKILGNILQCPKEPKFRSLRKSNKAIKDKILRSDAATSFLLAAGFEEMPGLEVFHCPEAANLTEMRAMLDLLNAAPPSDDFGMREGRAVGPDPPGTGGSADMKARIIEAFQKVDEYGDGFVAEDVLCEVLRLLEVPHSTISDALKADANKDGRVDYEEFCNWVFGSAQVTEVPSAPAVQSTSKFANRLRADVSAARHQETQVSDQPAVIAAAETAASAQQAQTERASSSSEDIDFRSLTIPELDARLRKLGISSRGCSGKTALVALLQAHMAEQMLEDRSAPPGDEFRGLSVQFISGGLIADLNVISTEKVYEIEPRLREKGERQTCPRDGQPGAAYVDVAPDPDAGRATHMLSYGWGYRVFAIANALESFCSQQGFNKRQVRVWICFACVNQHRVQEARSKGEHIPFETFQAVFGGRVSGIGRILALLAPWDKPLYITRVWCVYELYTAVTTENCKLDVIIPTEEQDSFRHSLARDGVLRAVWDTIKSVKVQDAEASVEEDKRRILALIQEHGPGFAALNHEVMKQLQIWFTHTSAMHLEERIAAGDFPPEAQSLCVEVSALMGDLGIRERSLQAVRLLGVALALPSMMADTPASAAMHCQLGQRLIDLEQFSEAAQELKKAHDIYENSAMDMERGTVLIVVVGLYARFRDMKSVECAHEQARALLADHPEHLASLYQNLAAAYLAGLPKKKKGMSAEERRMYDERMSNGVAQAISALESAERAYKQVGRVDTIEYVTCTAELAKVYARQAGLHAHSPNHDVALASAEESLDRAWSSLNAIGMTESLNAAHVFMARHEVGMVKMQIRESERSLLGAVTGTISAMTESEDYKRAIAITEACGFKKDEAQELLRSSMAGIFGHAFGGSDRDSATMMKHWGQYANAFGALLTREQEESVLPSWRAWTHPSLKQCADVSELAGKIITFISSEDLDGEDAGARKLCQELLAELSKEDTAVDSTARGTVWIEYLHLVKACSEQLGIKATQVLLRAQLEYFTYLKKQMLGLGKITTGMFSDFAGEMGNGKGEIGKGKVISKMGEALGGFGNVFAALGKGKGKGKGRGKGMGGPDAPDDKCCIQ